MLLLLLLFTWRFRVTRGGRQYLTKWRDLGYEHCSWEYLTDREYMGAEEGIKHYTELKESVTSGKKAKKKRICTNVSYIPARC